MKIASLHIYPLKSGRALDLPQAFVTPMGLGADRRVMLVGPDGNIITQRELPEIARISALPFASMLLLQIDGQPDMPVAPGSSDNRIDVTIWGEKLSAPVAADSVNARLSDWLGRPVRLVFLDPDAVRIASPDWAGPETPVGFSDGYQVLVTTTGSLTALNAEIGASGGQAVGMDRFRPNIVIEDDEPFGDDFWASLDIGGVPFDLVKPCARCIMTTQDQRTGSRGVSSPMPAMQKLRMSDDRRVPGVLFGWNAVPRGEGRLEIGDRVTVTKKRTEGWAIRKR